MVRVRRARALETTNLGYSTMRKTSLRILQLCSGATVLLSLSRVAFADASARLVYVRGAGAEQCPGEQALRAAASAMATSCISGRFVKTVHEVYRELVGAIASPPFSLPARRIASA